MNGGGRWILPTLSFPGEEEEEGEQKEEAGPPTGGDQPAHQQYNTQGRKGSVYILLDWIRNQTWAEFKGLLRGLCLWKRFPLPLVPDFRQQITGRKPLADTPTPPRRLILNDREVKI